MVDLTFLQYDLWYPVDSDRYGEPRASPSFVAYLLVAEAVGSSKTSSISYIPALQGYPQLAAYAIYDSSISSTRVSRLAVLNLSPATSNGTTTDSVGDVVSQNVSIDLTEFVLGKESGEVRVKRMTAPGLEVTNTSQVTWAGQSYVSGEPDGTEIVEQLEQGNVVNVRASEGVLVFL